MMQTPSVLVKGPVEEQEQELVPRLGRKPTLVLLEDCSKPQHLSFIAETRHCSALRCKLC